MSHTPDNPPSEMEYHLVQVDDNNKQKLLGNSNIKIIDATNLTVNDLAALQNGNTQRSNIKTSSSNPNLSSINSGENAENSLTTTTINSTITPNNHIIIYDNASKLDPPARLNHLKKIGTLAASQTIGTFQSMGVGNNNNNNQATITDDRARQIAQQIVEGESFMNIQNETLNLSTNQSHQNSHHHIRHININKENIPLKLENQAQITISTKNPRAALKRKQHSEVEKRRRSKINFWIDKIGDLISNDVTDTLRLIENSGKSDQMNSSESSPRSSKKKRFSEYSESKGQVPVTSPNKISKGDVLQKACDYRQV